MNTQSVVRRIDDLGRVVVPKEIRRALCIKEGDPLEFNLDTSTQSFQVKRYTTLNSLPDFITEYAESLETITDFACFITDDIHFVITSPNCPISQGTSIGRNITVAIDSEKASFVEGGFAFFLDEGNSLPLQSIILQPIKFKNDVVGTIGLLSEAHDKIPEHVKKTAEAAARFIENQLSR